MCIGHGIPTLRELNNNVRCEAASKWYDLGVELLDDKKMNIIKQNDNNVTVCCTNMFQEWLKQDDDASWNKLINALRAPSVELHSLASNIEKRFGNSKKISVLYDIVMPLYYRNE